MSAKIALCLAWLLVSARTHGQVTTAGSTSDEQAAAVVRQHVAASPTLHFTAVRLEARPPAAGWESGAISGLAMDRHGLVYVVQRGAKADPILVLNQKGDVLRSWGKGDDTLPHSIRIDPAGNVWTVDAASSLVIEYAPTGQRLMTIDVGGQPENGSQFHGATSVAFGLHGHIYITDGYGNARVLEYTADGRKLRQWGRSGRGPGEFHLPHDLQTDRQGTIYVADRENGRIEKFDRDGRYRGEIAQLGRVYALQLRGDVLWATMGSLDQPPGSPGWIVKLDRRSGRILGHLDVPAMGGHGLEVTPAGEPIITLGNGLLWFKAK